MKIGETLRMLREERGISQGKLAKMVAISQPAISQFETGNSIPNPRTIKVLAMVLNVPEDVLTKSDNVKNKEGLKCH